MLFNFNFAITLEYISIFFIIIFRKFIAHILYANGFNVDSYMRLFIVAFEVIVM